jgi:hypothetical protein
MTEQKRAAENPDCEVATRGYVKCVARRLDVMHDMNHNHLPSSLCWLLIAGCCAFGAPITREFSTIEIVIITAIPLFIAFHDFLMHLAVKCDQRRDCNFIQPHTEPPCEPKRECDE